MASRAECKAVVALRRKKERKARRQFVVEGAKSVEDLLFSAWPVHAIYATVDWQPASPPQGKVIPVTEQEMAEISSLEAPQSVLAVVENDSPLKAEITRGRWLVLDGVRDPGNLGTVCRLADWFGMDGLLLSGDCVDWTNPKVVQASMGSLFRVPIRVLDLTDPTLSFPAWCAGTFLEGEPLYDTVWPEDGWLVLGNEANGIRPAVADRVTQRFTIPRLGGAESLNVAMTAAIACSEWRRPGLIRR
jgi:TrmH family RNA methyltransferase